VEDLLELVDAASFFRGTPFPIQFFGLSIYAKFNSIFSVPGIVPGIDWIYLQKMSRILISKF